MIFRRESANEVVEVESSDKETMSIVDTVSGLLFKKIFQI